MNYTELRRMAESQPWAAKYKAKVDAENEGIREKRQEWLNVRQGIIMGDFVRDGEKLLRVAHVWPEDVQLTDGRYGGSFYLGDGYVSYSGGLDPAIPLERFEDTGERNLGPCWFFSQDYAQAHNGYYTEAEFKVWRLKAARGAQ